MKFETLVSMESLVSENITTMFEKSFIADEVFQVLTDSYKNVKGGLHFKNVDELILKTSSWQLIYFEERVVGAIIYKAKKGLKLVALGVSTFVPKNVRENVKKLLALTLKESFRKVWMEVSEGFEKFVLNIGGDKFMVKNRFASTLTGKTIIKLGDNGFHYSREVVDGVIKSKVIIGTPKI